VHYGAKAQAVALPAVTFRQNGGGTAGPLGAGVISGVIYDFEAWENGGSATLIADILEQVERLLDTRRGIAPPLSLVSGQCFNSEVMTECSVLFDTNQKAWYGLVRYRFVEARY
jgi:hypothetical protein